MIKLLFEILQLAIAEVLQSISEFMGDGNQNDIMH